MRLSRDQTVLIRIAPISSKTNPGYTCISYTNQEDNKSNSAGSTESKLGRVFPHQIGSSFFAVSLLLKLRYKLEAERSNKTAMSNLQKLQKCWETS